jgi:hypothetical protein
MVPSPHRIEFEPYEEAFLRHYSDSLLRLRSMIDSGAAAALHLTPDDTQALETAASRTISKAELLDLATLASATGADKLYFLARLKRVCDDDAGHTVVKGLLILGKIHGLFSSQKLSRTAPVQIVFGPPVPQRAQTPTDLPFTIDITPTKPTT